MEIILGIVIAALVVALVFMLILIRRKPPVSESAVPLQLLAERLEDLGALKSQINTIATAQSNLQNNLTSLDGTLKGLETKLVETTGSVKDSVINDFREARRVLDALKTDLEARKQREKELYDATRRIEAVIAGSKSRGQAGEDILSEAFKQFPPSIIETNFRVKGKVVEYALKLSDGKRVPIDAKWTSPELTANLATADDPAVRDEIARKIEEAVLNKVKEVNKYLDPAVTVSWGIAAIPDSVYAVCRRVHLEAFKQNVIVMPFSLTVIYLLTLYHLHLQYFRSADIEKLEGYLKQIEKGIDKIDKELENKITRGARMVINAADACKQTVGEMRSAAAFLKELPAGGGAAELSAGDPSGELESPATEQKLF